MVSGVFIQNPTTAYTAILSWSWLASRGGQIKPSRLLGSSHEVLIPYSASNLSTLNSGLPHPIRSTFRFSQPLSGLLLKLRNGLISYHLHSWDLPYRVFPLNAVPHPRQIRYLSILHHPSELAQVHPRRITKFRLPESMPNQADTLTTGFNAQVRSHPTSVLPDASGRYSLELSYPFYYAAFKLLT